LLANYSLSLGLDLFSKAPSHYLVEMPVITLDQDQDDGCYLTHHILTGKARLRLSKKDI